MLGHASLRAEHNPFTSILLAAAGRAWTRTRPVPSHPFRRMSDQKRSSPNGPGASHHGESSTNRLLRNEFGQSIANSVLVSERAALTRDLDPHDIACMGSVGHLEASAKSDYVFPGQDGASGSSSSSIPYRIDSISLAETSQVNSLPSHSVSNEGLAEKYAPSQAPEVDETYHAFSHSGRTTKVPPLRSYVEEQKSVPDFLAVSQSQGQQDLPLDDHAHNLPESSYPNPFLPHEKDEDQDFRSKESALPHTTSASSLYQNLVQLSGVPLPPSISRSVKLRGLLDFHRQHRQFQSTDSFNLIISLAIAIRDFATASALLKELAQRGLHNNPETRKLSIRFWLRQGKWTEMWVRETDAGKRSVPLPVWNEFFGAVRIFEKLSTDASLEERQAYREGCASALSSRHTLLMRYRPALTPAQTSTMPPRAMFSLMRWMLQGGQRKEALNLTVTYFQRLPRVLSSSYRRCCTGIMNLHLKARAEEVCELRPLLRKLLSLHPELRPNPDTLWLVLGAIRTRQGNSVELVRIKRHFQEKWGEEIADERILSFVADRARRDRYPRVMKKVIQEYEQRRERSTPRAWVPSSEQPSNPDARYTHKAVFYDRDEEDRRWEFYRKCLGTLGSIPRTRRKVRKVKKVKVSGNQCLA